MSGVSTDQYRALMKPLNTSRIAKRKQGGKELSYLESYDVKAHLIRTFGFCNFDSEVESEEFLGTREYDGRKQNEQNNPPKPMVEVIWKARVRLTIRSEDGRPLATYAEGAVGSASGPFNMLGEHHDNALKTAASDALKRCATFLGSQFGLSLYANGSTKEVVRGTLVMPHEVRMEQEAAKKKQDQASQGKADAVAHSVGAVEQTDEGERTNEGGSDETVSTGNSDDGSGPADGSTTDEHDHTPGDQGRQ